MKLIPSRTWEHNLLKISGKVKLKDQPWFQGVLLMCCVVVAMLLANLPFTKGLYESILNTSIVIHLTSPDGKVNLLFPQDMTIEKFINDILMVIFFFTVGLEIKREVAYGELSSPKKALMPVIAAFGGVIAPAVIYTIINHGTPAASGWGIPTATDIAFAVCILTVLGDKVPVSLKVFLTALAIADDLIAILVVAIFYGGQINLLLLGISFLIIFATFWMRHRGVKNGWAYIGMALLLWVFFYYSGIHATMSGVVMAFLIPSKPVYSGTYFRTKFPIFVDKLTEFNHVVPDYEFPNPPQKHYLREISKLSMGSMDMSYKVERRLSPWVNFLIMPIFALANAGVELSLDGFMNGFTPDPVNGSVGLGILLGLVLGKPLGITLFSFVAIKCKIGEMPSKATWPMFFAVACLGGIGFTMSIFVDTLSFGDQAPAAMEQMRAFGKVAVLCGSICAGVLGSLLVNVVYKLSNIIKK